LQPLIDRETLFGNPDRAQPALSPDGAWISFLAPRQGVLNLWIAPADAPEQARPVTAETGRGVQGQAWAESSERLLFVQDNEGDENWRLFSVDPVTREIVDLTPLDGVQASVLATSPRRPHEVLITLNDRDPALFDPFLVDLRTGSRTRVTENPGFVSWGADWDLELTLAGSMLPDGGTAFHARVGDGWEPVQQVGQVDSLTTLPIGRNAAGTVQYWLDSRGRDTAALVAEALDTGVRVVLAEDPRADVVDWLTHPTTGEAQAAVVVFEEQRHIVLDEAIGPHLTCLKGHGNGALQVISRSTDDTRWLVAWQGSDGPLRFALYETATRAVRDLFVSNDALVGLPLAARRPEVIQSRDGLSLVSYVSLPPWRDNEGRPPEPLPMVLLVHGGPWARDMPGFNTEHQLLANRGYAVLSVNFRGSTGFGKAFLNAGDFEWSGKMHDDLIDAVEWAVDAGIARRDAIAIMGGSYGGYAALVGLTFTPKVFRCAVDIVGPSNLVTLLQSVPPYWAPLKAQFTTRVGTDETEEGRAALLERSPLSRVDAIERPLLIAQGANDPRVKRAEADQIVAELRRRSIPYRYALFADEGHGFARPENRIAFYAEVEAFLAEHLGGRAQALGDAHQGSSIEVTAG